MKTIRADSSFARGSDLEPARYSFGKKSCFVSLWSLLHLFASDQLVSSHTQTQGFALAVWFCNLEVSVLKTSFWNWFSTASAHLKMLLTRNRNLETCMQVCTKTRNLISLQVAAKIGYKFQPEGTVHLAPPVGFNPSIFLFCIFNCLAAAFYVTLAQDMVTMMHLVQ